MDETPIKKDQLNAFLADAPFGVVFLDADNRIERANPEAARLLGWQREDLLLGLSFREALPATPLSALFALLQAPAEAQRGNGWLSLRFSEVGTGPQRVKAQVRPGPEGGKVLYLQAEEQPQTASASEDLPRQDGKYEKIFESAVIGIGVLDGRGYFVEVNQTFAECFNRTKEELIRAHYASVFSRPMLERIEELVDIARSGAEPHLKNVVSIENPSGNHRVLAFSLAIIGPKANQPETWMMIVEDITHQQDTHKALIQSEKLALTGRLAASLAHEINNPLQTSIGCLGLAEEMLAEDDRDLKVYVNMAIEELRRSARIVKKLRDLNRKTDQTERFPVNLLKVINDVLLLTQNKLVDRDIVPVIHCEQPKPVLMASRDQLQQVFLNLVMNAIDALPNGGQIVFELHQTSEPDGYSITVQDSGMGISPENLDHLFDPFFTTKADGLGLGLYICKTIVEDHQGTLAVDSTLGEGTRITIWLPGLVPNQ